MYKVNTYHVTVFCGTVSLLIINVYYRMLQKNKMYNIIRMYS